MIKIRIRKNLFYPMMLLIFTFIRGIDYILLINKSEFNGTVLLTILMFLGEFIFGFIFYLWNLHFLSKEINRSFMGIKLKLIQGKSEISHPDKNIKIYFLIFMASFFDFTLFLIDTYFLPRLYYNSISISLTVRLRSILTLCSALLCYFLLRFPILKHQLFSLLIIFICLLSVIGSEFYFRYSSLIFYALIFTFVIYFLNSCLDIVEKYLLEYNYINPFKIIMLEGIIGLLLITLYSIINGINPFNEIKTNDTVLLVIFLLIYFASGAGRNIYRIITNKLFSPMTRTLTDSILDPISIILYYKYNNDFIYKREVNFYFIINLVISFIIVICGCIYNEILVIFCCQLDENTHSQVAHRASILEKDYELSSGGSNASDNQSIKSDESNESNEEKD